MQQKDLISREAAVKLARSLVEYDEGGWVMDVRAVAVEDIVSLPAVDAVPVVHGRWIDGRGSWSTSNCSVCGWKIPYSEDAYIGYTKFCPNCGAKMNKEDAKKMKTIDCRICTNCDKENDRCKVYGSDPKAAVEACASKNFGAYHPSCGARMDKEGDDALD